MACLLCHQHQCWIGASLEWVWREGREADQLTARDVLVVDEAGMVGDPEQLQVIEAGAAFRAIVERVGAAEIRHTRRQRVGWQREATRELATGRTAEAVAAPGLADPERAAASYAEWRGVVPERRIKRHDG